MFNFLKRKNPNPKLFVIGLDCAPPELVFEQWRQELPHLNRLITNGSYGRLKSCIPCITVPAWSVMTASHDPGELGIYGFRNRSDTSYHNMSIASAAAVKADRVWDILSRAGKQVIVVGVPPMYPVKPVNGIAVGCFLTPATVGVNEAGARMTKIFTYPAEMSGQINEWAGGEYLVDVKQFRTENKDFLLKQIYEMTEKRFAVVKKLMTERPWDFFMFVEMGTDRIHHGFWKYHDPTHWKHEPGNPYQNAIRDYYHMIDEQIGQLLSLLDDNTAVMVLSDHGAKKMDGGICVNEWLRREGYLVLKEEPEGQGAIPFEKVEVDWEKTTAWSSGGYYGRIFLNVQGREPSGVIPPERYETVRDELVEKLAALTDHEGRNIGTVSYKPQGIYREVRGVAPDLIVYFGNLFWRAVGSFGHHSIHTFENDTGPDDANHAEYGIYIYYDPRQRQGGRELHGLELMDVGPTMLDALGVPVPGDMRGRRISRQ